MAILMLDFTLDTKNRECDNKAFIIEVSDMTKRKAGASLFHGYALHQLVYSRLIRPQAEFLDRCRGHIAVIRDNQFVTAAAERFQRLR